MLNGVTLTLSRKAGETDHLFGSVTSGDITEALAAQGFEIDKRKIQLPDSIKLLGDYEIPIKLYRDVVATVKLTVQREA